MNLSVLSSSMLPALLCVAAAFLPQQAPVCAWRRGTSPAVRMLADDTVDAIMMKTIVMKFGGSSVRDAERITEVCKLVQLQIKNGLKPHLVCSAMGPTTNNLLAGADRALARGEVDLCAVRELHSTTADLGLEEDRLYGWSSCSRMRQTLSGVAMLGELSLARDKVVSYGERCSAHGCCDSQGHRRLRCRSSRGPG